METSKENAARLGANARLDVPADESQSIDLLACLEALVSRKGMIVAVTAVAALISAALSFLVPKSYTATALVMPPEQDQSLSSALLGQFAGGLGSMAGGVLGKVTLADTYVSMLRTETIKDAIIDRFRLLDVYDKKFRTDAYKVLDRRARMSAGSKDGIITISVEDDDPKRAAAMTNAFVEELAKMAVKLSNQGGGNNRAFLEQRLAAAKTDLAKAEDDLKTFQATYKALNLPEQTKAALTGVAELKTQVAAQEVQLAILRRTFTETSQEVRTARTLLDNLRVQLSQLEGRGGGTIPSVGAVPALGQEYLRLTRNFKVQENLVEFLTKQYEAARLVEAKDVSSMQVLQKARIPERNSKPKRGLMIGIGTLLGLLGSSLVAIMVAAFERLPEQDRERWTRVAQMFGFRRTIS